MSENKKNEKNGFSKLWQKTSDIGKKAVGEVKTFAEQTKKNIHDAQAKKYAPITDSCFSDKDFRLPAVIEIVDDSANREFVTCDNAIGWIEKHEEIDVLHMYASFVKSCGIEFIPLPQCDNVYCRDHFDSNRFINSNRIFGKATEEKLAELEHIAYCLGAKSCSVEVVEVNSNFNKKAMSAGANVNVAAEAQSKNNNMQSGKTVSFFEGNNTPKKPTLKWFLHDDNINGLIEMRCVQGNFIKSKVMELKGSSSATMSKKVACAIDSVMRIKGEVSMERQAIKEHSNILIYEIEF